ncbi:amidase [Achromobacter agilis]|uniref:Glutamyl-tRNA(Gln) amidotransferase subunit A n=1 Tax=Achromobacter agilis TaxID=1353888 RepID=A0A446CNK6_9BURK|nr:amidase [Achromobacter agilis]SSW69537.1 Glutamyl-tRNA(Gln) amidotransferase subunit A [Achromobacter agilis]
MSRPSLLAGPLPGDPVFGRSMAELQAAMAAGSLSAEDLVRGYLARIAAHDQSGPALNAVLALNGRALDEAAARDAQRKRGAVLGPLHGIPILFKDNIDTAGMPTTAGSLALAQRRPPRDADVVRRLREAGAIVLGKTTLHELACGITNVSSLSGRTRNAYDAERVPGGSSGGSAVAVASSFAAAAIGSDTSGSIRIPAAFNQVWGLRPTAGRCSTAGVVPLSPTLDTVGPMARSLVDLAVLWAAMTGPAGAEESARRAGGAWRVGTLDALFGAGDAEREVSGHARAALARWQAHGARIQPAALALDDAQLAAANITGYEFRDALAHCLRDAGLPVRSLADILEGAHPHPEVAALLRERDALRDPDGSGREAVLGRMQAIRGQVLAALEHGALDLLAYPSVRGAPVLLGEPQRGGNGLLAAVTGLPALSVPIGFTNSGIPVGLELLGPAGSEELLLRAAQRFELCAAG